MDVALGVAGSDWKSVNPIRDTVFYGNSEAYYNAEMIASTSAIVGEAYLAPWAMTVGGGGAAARQGRTDKIMEQEAAATKTVLRQPPGKNITTAMRVKSGSLDPVREVKFAGNAGTRPVIGKLRVIDGKVGGKIPVDEFNSIRKSSVKNPNANSITLGKYTNGPDSYIAKAGKDSSYFDLGNDWRKVQNKYNLSDAEMFEYFNKPAIDDAIAGGKTIKFSHNPLNFPDSFLEQEWEYLKNTPNLKDVNLVESRGIWYVK